MDQRVLIRDVSQRFHSPVSRFKAQPSKARIPQYTQRLSSGPVGNKEGNMSPKKYDQNAQAYGVHSLKADIQSLAHQLWIGKSHATTGADWLVDGRLTIQLDELSEGQLLRVKRLLAKSVGKRRIGKTVRD